jgi:hypothetical protein
MYGFPVPNQHLTTQARPYTSGPALDEHWQKFSNGGTPLAKPY